MAQPFGPPPSFATMDLRPSSQTRVSVWRRISTTSRLPSPTHTGPSGNQRSSAMMRITVILEDVHALPALLRRAGAGAYDRASVTEARGNREDPHGALPHRPVRTRHSRVRVRRARGGDHRPRHAGRERERLAGRGA